jgi:hypothetical protein
MEATPMTTLYIFPAFEDQPTETLYQINAATEAECEQIAGEHFGDTDRFAWAYTGIPDSESAPEYTEVV